MDYIDVEQIATQTLGNDALDALRQTIVPLVEDMIDEYELDQTTAGKNITQLWEDTEEVRTFVYLVVDLVNKINDTLDKATSGPCAFAFVALNSPFLFDELKDRVGELANFWNNGGLCRVRSELEVPGYNWPSTSAKIVTKVDLRTGETSIDIPLSDELNFRPDLKLLGTQPAAVAQLPGGPKFYAIGGQTGFDTQSGILEDELNITWLALRGLASLLPGGDSYLRDKTFVWIRADHVNETGDCSNVRVWHIDQSVRPDSDGHFDPWLSKYSVDSVCYIKLVDENTNSWYVLNPLGFRGEHVLGKAVYVAQPSAK